MPIRFSCPHCTAAIKAPDTHSGQTLPCPKCGKSVTVPAEVPPPEPPAAEAPGATPEIPPPFEAPTDPQPADELPEIVTQQPSAAAPPPPPADDAPQGGPYASPRTSSSPGSPGDLQEVRIVDLKIPFSSVFRFAFQFFVANMLMAFVVWLAMMLFLGLLAAIGFGLGVGL